MSGSRYIKNEYARMSNERSRFIAYRGWRALGGIVNDLNPRIPISTNLIDRFREQKALAATAIVNGATIFTWTLNDADGRSREYDRYDDRAWQRWLALYRHHHFKWYPPNDQSVESMRRSIRQLGRSTWANLFTRYLIPDLDHHDGYSLPDVYYITTVLGHVPTSAIDIGGGWGRLGMAWQALGVQQVGIADSIEQSYMVQHQYLNAILGPRFVEMLLEPDTALMNGHDRAIFHFPFWDLQKVSSQSIEVISTVQVLREVSREFLNFLFTQLKRILVNGGVFYVRDNDHTYPRACMHDVKITETLQEIGFDVIRFDELIQSRHIHGVPRVFRLRR